MHRLTLSYRWQKDTGHADHTPANHGLRNPLMDLLQAVHDHGSISGAARGMGLSYRHVWGELKRWEAELAEDLVLWEKGQSARLSPFASKLLWAERQAQARLGPQIEALQSELQRSFAAAFDPQAQLLSLHASHDEGLSRLRQFTAAYHNLHLDIQFMGSVDAVTALQQGRTTMAGFHLVLPEKHPTNVALRSLGERTFGALLNPARHALIGFATRRQGLMVAPGNPLSINCLQDVVKASVRFALRGPGTGTYLLLKELMDQNALPVPAHWNDTTTETSHTAVAQAIVGGYADAGLGIEAAARAKGLDFVPLATEHYFLACDLKVADSPPVLALRTALQSAQWQTEVSGLPGYAACKSGQLLTFGSILGHTV